MMKPVLRPIDCLKVMGIAVSAFLLGLAAYKATLGMLHLDTISETEIQELRTGVKKLNEELKNRPTKEEFIAVQDRAEELKNELALWNKKHADFKLFEKKLKKA